MSRFISKKRALLIATATSLVLVAVAVAFYSTTGSGSGTGQARNGYVNNLSIAGNAADGLVPGGEVNVVTGTGGSVPNGTITNNNPGAAKFGTISGTVVAGQVDADAVGPDCPDSYFHVTNVSESDADDVLTAGQSLPFTAKVTMDDSTTENQNVCKNASLTITWASS